MPLRVYLSGSNPQAEAAAALAVSDPRGPSYARYLTPGGYQQAFGPSAAQVSTVSDWLTAEGMTITAYADAGGFSVPAALGSDITTVTGFEQWTQANGSGGIGLSAARAGTARAGTTQASTDRTTAATRPADAASGFHRRRA